MTYQMPDKLHIEGKILEINELPIIEKENLIIKLNEDEKEIQSNKYMWFDSSCCWRNYIATWEIKNNILYLKSVKGMYKIEETLIMANWFTGTITVIDTSKRGDIIFSYPVVKEITIDKGKVTNIKEITGDVRDE